MTNRKRKNSVTKPSADPEEILLAIRQWNDEMYAAVLRLRGKLASLAVSDAPVDGKVLSPDSRRERLCVWRREEARRRGVAPYFVLTNGVVERLTAMEVLGREDLRRVPGIGPRKMEVYGDTILKVLAGR